MSTRKLDDEGFQVHRDAARAASLDVVQLIRRRAMFSEVEMARRLRAICGLHGFDHPDDIDEIVDRALVIVTALPSRPITRGNPVPPVPSIPDPPARKQRVLQ